MGFIKSILLKMGTTTEYTRIFLIWEANPSFSHSALICWCQCNPYFPNWWKRESRRKRREEGNVRELFLLHPTIKIHDFLDVFTELTPLIISNARPSSHLVHLFPSFHPSNLCIFQFSYLFSPSPFRFFFSSVKPTPLPIFSSLFAFSIHLHLFISWTHRIFLFSTLFTLISILSSLFFSIRQRFHWCQQEIHPHQHNICQYGLVANF